MEESSVSVIRGWGCTPTGEPPAAAVAAVATDSDTPAANNTCLPTLFMRGWRRNALYGILVLLMLLVFVNIALTLWIISVLRLTMSGIGPIKIIKGGIQLEGQAWVVDNLIASTISSQVGQPIVLQSHRNFSVLVADPGKLDYSKFIMKRDKVELSGRILDIRDSRGSPIFLASKEEVRMFTDTFVIDSVGGVNIRTAVQAKLITAPPGFDLELESLTRRLDLRAPQSIVLESRAGHIEVKAHGNIRLDSEVGSIRLNASNIMIPNLTEAPLSDKPQKPWKNRKVYQLCVCSTGKLFLAAPDAPCTASEDDKELCR